MTCALCGLPVYVDGPEHPCCTQARTRGESTCFGCESMKRREQRRASA